MLVPQPANFPNLKLGILPVSKLVEPFLSPFPCQTFVNGFFSISPELVDNLPQHRQTKLVQRFSFALAMVINQTAAIRRKAFESMAKRKNSLKAENVHRPLLKLAATDRTIQRARTSCGDSQKVGSKFISIECRWPGSLRYSFDPQIAEYAKHLRLEEESRQNQQNHRMPLVTWSETCNNVVSQP